MSVMSFASYRSSRIRDDNAPGILSHSSADFQDGVGHGTTIEAVLAIIYETGLPGPVFLTGHPQFIGQGSQFVVHRDCVAWTEDGECITQDVAVKSPRFELGDDHLVDLAGQKAHDHLKALYDEIAAFRDSRLHNHPNIAELLGWSNGGRGFESHLVLVMEIAVYDLETLLASNSSTTTSVQKFKLCQDVASGLDAIHECNIIHGDLKPRNILLFEGEDRLVAKLTDFGLSMSSASAVQVTSIGGTPGWRAPELELGKPLDAQQVFKVDNYSFGLLAWSTMLLSGMSPTKSSAEEVDRSLDHDFGAAANDEDNGLLSVLYQAIKSLLKVDPRDRPAKVSDLINSQNDSDRTRILNDGPHKESHHEQELVPHESVRYFDWECEFIPSSSLKDSKVGRARAASLSRISACDLLRMAATEGSRLARSIIPAAYRFFELSPPAHVSDRLELWLEDALSAGCLMAKAELTSIGSVSTEDILDDFRHRGGYNQYYDNMFHDHIRLGRVHLSRWSRKYRTKLQWLASYGSRSQLEEYMSEPIDLDINVMTDTNETPLYLASMRGLWDIVDILLQHNASTGHRCGLWGVTSMHWVFAMHENHQPTAIKRLLDQGADIDALARYAIPLPNFPFVLPAGSPLHWAVVTKNEVAIRTLIESGANLLLYDGSDPYRHDDRIRVLNCFEPLNKELYSVPEAPTRGLTALDYAVMQYDPFIFRYLISTGRKVDVNKSDETGFALLHRLSSGPIRRLNAGAVFSVNPFVGSAEERYTLLKDTIDALLTLGADLEQLSEPLWMWTGSRYTPLMLAVQNASLDVVRALLEAGANPRTVSNVGKTALHCLDDLPRLTCDMTELLCSYGADVNAKNQYGEGPVMCAARGGAVSTVELFLPLGADIDERIRGPDTAGKGSGIFVRLARWCGTNSIPCVEEDAAIARMLEQYVLSCPDHEKRDRVLNVGQEGSTTTLYKFAASGMVLCVRLLLDYGVDAAALSKGDWIWHQQATGRVRTRSQETALDVVLRTKASRRQKMIQERHLSQEVFDQADQRADEIIRMLRSAMAAQRPPVAEPVPHL